MRKILSINLLNRYFWNSRKCSKLLSQHQGNHFLFSSKIIEPFLQTNKVKIKANKIPSFSFYWRKLLYSLYSFSCNKLWSWIFKLTLFDEIWSTNSVQSHSISQFLSELENFILIWFLWFVIVPIWKKVHGRKKIRNLASAFNQIESHSKDNWVNWTNTIDSSDKNFHVSLEHRNT